MKPIFISLSPNTERDDVRAAVAALLHPQRWRKDDVVDQAAEQLREVFQRPVIFASSGRAALAELLKAQGIGKGDEVIIQAFTCVAVPAAVMWSGATPVYADIDPTTYNFDVQDVRAKVSTRTKAIIIQHTFGIPGPLSVLLQLAQEHHLFVIEDCAHALGGKYEGKFLGTFGDAAVLSFGRDKMLSSVFGGAIVTRDQGLAQRLMSGQARLPYPPWWWVAQQLLHPLLISAIKPFYFVSGIGKALLVAAQRVQLLSKAVLSMERRGARPAHTQWRYSPALAELLLVQLPKLSRYTTQRRAIAAQYAAAIKVKIDSRESSWLRFPLRVDKPKVIHQDARRQHILLGDWYDGAVVPAQGNFEHIHYVPGSCPEAERAAREILNLPTYPTMQEADIERVIQFITSHIHS